MKNPSLLLIYAFSIFASSTSFAERVNLPKDKLNFFQSSFFDSEKEGCQRLATGPSQPFENWLIGEFIKLGVVPQGEVSQVKDQWEGNLTKFKIGEDEIQGNWVKGSQGTWGTVDTKLIKQPGSTDAGLVTELKAPLVNVGRGTLNELKGMSDLGGKIWIFERSENLPSLLAIAIEAKNRGALGIIVYEKRGWWGLRKRILPTVSLDKALFLEGTSEIPMVTVAEEVASSVIKKMSKGPLVVTLELKTDYPVSRSEHRIFAKKGSRNFGTLITAVREHCDEVAAIFAFLDWAQKSEFNLHGLYFGILDTERYVSTGAQDIPKVPEKLGNAVGKLPVDSSLVRDPSKFLKTWLEADLHPTENFDGRELMAKALNISSHLKGLIDAEDLKKYTEKLKTIDRIKNDRSIVDYDLHLLYEPIFDAGTSPSDDLLTGLATDTKTLREIYTLAQKGLWDKALMLVKKLKDFAWADNVSPATFVEYKKVVKDSGNSVGVQILTELQKGKKNLDLLLPLLEQEIDRLDKQLSDNFFRLQEGVGKISVDPQKGT